MQQAAVLGDVQPLGEAHQASSQPLVHGGTGAQHVLDEQLVQQAGLLFDLLTEGNHRKLQNGIRWPHIGGGIPLNLQVCN